LVAQVLDDAEGEFGDLVDDVSVAGLFAGSVGWPQFCQYFTRAGSVRASWMGLLDSSMRAAMVRKLKISAIHASRLGRG
jgi:hypothetical protein